MCMFVLAACGEKSQEDVIKSLEKKTENLKGYKTQATMVFHQGDKKQKYKAEISYKSSDFYKIVLDGGEQSNKQMIIKNDNGVFVLTPALKKKYSFESKWPNNRSQYYLYQSLVTDILNDPEPDFETKDDQYVFTTATNYKTKELAHQKIVLNKDLEPKKVQIMDKDMNTVIDVSFNDFKFNPEFEKGTFDEDKAMSAARIEKPTMANQDKELTVVRPNLNWENTKLALVKKVKNDDKVRHVIKYEGDRSFTLIESKSDVAETSSTVSASGNPVDLGYAVGTITDGSLSWSYNGTDFYLASDNLTQKEMIEVAGSMNSGLVK